MKYLGGKHRIAKRLAEVLNPSARKAGIYVEPFVGAAWVMCQIDPSVKRIAADANEALITMWAELCNGWEPPETLSEAEHTRLKALKDPRNPLTAFAGFGCSFAGMWFSSYARDAQGNNYAAMAARSLRKKREKLEHVIWQSGDYRERNYTKGAVIYCDPPYANTIPYKATGVFDSKIFWEWCREKSHTNQVYISEYEAPPDFERVLTIETSNSVGTVKKSPRVEGLFVYGKTS
jgi:DNA adenine methylase